MEEAKAAALQRALDGFHNMMILTHEHSRSTSALARREAFAEKESRERPLERARAEKESRMASKFHKPDAEVDESGLTKAEKEQLAIFVKSQQARTMPSPTDIKTFQQLARKAKKELLYANNSRNLGQMPPEERNKKALNRDEQKTVERLAKWAEKRRLAQEDGVKLPDLPPQVAIHNAAKAKQRAAQNKISPDDRFLMQRMEQEAFEARTAPAGAPRKQEVTFDDTAPSYLRQDERLELQRLMNKVGQTTPQHEKESISLNPYERAQTQEMEDEVTTQKESVKEANLNRDDKRLIVNMLKEVGQTEESKKQDSLYVSKDNHVLDLDEKTELTAMADQVRELVSKSAPVQASLLMRREVPGPFSKELLDSSLDDPDAGFQESDDFATQLIRDAQQADSSDDDTEAPEVDKEEKASTNTNSSDALTASNATGSTDNSQEDASTNSNSSASLTTSNATGSTNNSQASNSTNSSVVLTTSNSSGSTNNAQASTDTNSSAVLTTSNATGSTNNPQASTNTNSSAALTTSNATDSTNNSQASTNTNSSVALTTSNATGSTNNSQASTDTNSSAAFTTTGSTNNSQASTNTNSSAELTTTNATGSTNNPQASTNTNSPAAFTTTNATDSTNNSQASTNTNSSAAFTTTNATGSTNYSQASTSTNSSAALATTNATGSTNNSQASTNTNSSAAFTTTNATGSTNNSQASSNTNSFEVLTTSNTTGSTNNSQALSGTNSSAVLTTSNTTGSTNNSQASSSSNSSAVLTTSNTTGSTNNSQASSSTNSSEVLTTSNTTGSTNSSQALSGTNSSAVLTTSNTTSSTNNSQASSTSNSTAVLTTSNTTGSTNNSQVPDGDDGHNLEPTVLIPEPLPAQNVSNASDAADDVTDLFRTSRANQTADGGEALTSSRKYADDILANESTEAESLGVLDEKWLLAALQRYGQKRRLPRGEEAEWDEQTLHKVENDEKYALANLMKAAEKAEMMQRMYSNDKKFKATRLNSYDKRSIDKMISEISVGKAKLANARQPKELTLTPIEREFMGAMMIKIKGAFGIGVANANKGHVQVKGKTNSVVDDKALLAALQRFGHKRKLPSGQEVDWDEQALSALSNVEKYALESRIKDQEKAFPRLVNNLDAIRQHATDANSEIGPFAPGNEAAANGSGAMPADTTKMVDHATDHLMNILGEDYSKYVSELAAAGVSLEKYKQTFASIKGVSARNRGFQSDDTKVAAEALAYSLRPISNKYSVDSEDKRSLTDYEKSLVTMKGAAARNGVHLDDAEIAVDVLAHSLGSLSDKEEATTVDIQRHLQRRNMKEVSLLDKVADVEHSRPEPDVPIWQILDSEAPDPSLPDKALDDVEDSSEKSAEHQQTVSKPHMTQNKITAPTEDLVLVDEDAALTAQTLAWSKRHGVVGTDYIKPRDRRLSTRGWTDYARGSLGLTAKRDFHEGETVLSIPSRLLMYFDPREGIVHGKSVDTTLNTGANADPKLQLAAALVTWRAAKMQDWDTYMKEVSGVHMYNPLSTSPEAIALQIGFSELPLAKSMRAERLAQRDRFAAFKHMGGNTSAKEWLWAETVISSRARHVPMGVHRVIVLAPGLDMIRGSNSEVDRNIEVVAGELGTDQPLRLVARRFILAEEELLDGGAVGRALRPFSEMQVSPLVPSAHAAATCSDLSTKSSGRSRTPLLRSEGNPHPPTPGSDALFKGVDPAGCGLGIDVYDTQALFCAFQAEAKAICNKFTPFPCPGNVCTFVLEGTFAAERANGFWGFVADMMGDFTEAHLAHPYLLRACFFFGVILVIFRICQLFEVTYFDVKEMYRSLTEREPLGPHVRDSTSTMGGLCQPTTPPGHFAFLTSPFSSRRRHLEDCWRRSSSASSSPTRDFPPRRFSGNSAVEAD